MIKYFILFIILILFKKIFFNNNKKNIKDTSNNIIDVDYEEVE